MFCTRENVPCFKILSKSIKLPTTEYVEKHHIIPKSMGGNNSNENIAILTAREHFVCHLLLTKMTTGNNNYKMKWFHYHNLIPYFDMALMDEETIATNPKYAHIGYTFESKPAEVAKKLYESKIIYIHPDGFEKWKNILLLLHKRKHCLLCSVRSDDY